MTTIQEYYTSGLSTTEIGKIYNLNPSTVYRKLKKLGIKFRAKTDLFRKYKINQQYFDIIDTDEKAYWLGFLFADGCNIPKHTRIIVNLGIKDKEHLLKLKDCLSAETPIRSSKNKKFCRLEICSKRLSSALNNLGCVQAKSLVLKYPDIDEKYSSAFMLGYFDGDGSIGVYSKNKRFSLLGTAQFLKKYQELMIKYCKVSKTKISKRKNIFALCYSGNKQIAKIRDFLYSVNSPCLDRKKKIFDS